MNGLKDLIEREIERYIAWTTDDKSYVTTASAKLFAEHVVRLYAGHIPDAGGPAESDVQGEPVAMVDADDDGMWADILPNVTVKVGQILYAAPQPAEQQPSTDVAGLVESLEMARDRIESERRSGEWGPLLRDIDDALAAYRNKGE